MNDYRPLADSQRLRLEAEFVSLKDAERIIGACLSAAEAVAAATVETVHEVAGQEGRKIGALLTELGWSRTKRRGYEHSFYVALSSRRGPVKVGVSRDPAARIRGLNQAQSSGRLELVAAFPPTSYQLEQATLARFSGSIAHGEWLKRTPEVEAFVEACRVVSPGGEP